MPAAAPSFIITAQQTKAESEAVLSTSSTFVSDPPLLTNRPIRDENDTSASLRPAMHIQSKECILEPGEGFAGLGAVKQPSSPLESQRPPLVALRSLNSSSPSPVFVPSHLMVLSPDSPSQTSRADSIDVDMLLSMLLPSAHAEQQRQASQPAAASDGFGY